jgi:sarcosine oxidase
VVERAHGRNTVRSNLTSDVDHVVIGLGGIGSAAAYWLARLSPDASIVGLEQFSLGHDRGASHDHSRIIRYSYHTPGYVRLAAEAYETWDAVAAEAGEELVVRTGGIDLFPEGGAIGIDDYVNSLTAVGVPFELIDSDEIRRRFPQLRVGDNVTGLTQADTGIAPAAKGTSAHQRLAAARGVTMHTGVAVQQIASDGTGDLTVVTNEGSYRTGSVVIAADAWTAALVAPLGLDIPLAVTREQVAYYPSQTLEAFAIGQFPVWIWMDDPSYYGFPVYGDLGAVKAAEDVGGQPTTADTRSFETDTDALQRMTEFLQRTVPEMVGTSPPRVKTCLYTMTPDRDFVLDTVPGHPGIQVALGSAHGFKFASWFGRALAERAVLGNTRSDITPFRFDRPGLTDRAFVPNYMT